MADYSSGELRAARETILRTTLPYLPTVQRMRAANAPYEAQRDLIWHLINETRDGKGLGPEIDLLLEFADRVVVCVESDICDRAVAAAYFSTRYRSLFDNFKPYIEDRRLNAENFARVGERILELPTP